MKFKKIWILWICYYSAAIIGTVLAAVLLRDRWNFNAWSAFPIVYILVLAFLARYVQSDIYAEISYEDSLRDDSHWYNHKASRSRPIDDYQQSREYFRPWNSYWTKVALLCIPIYPCFIFFFSDNAKAGSFFFSFGIYVTALALWMLVFDGSRKKIKAEKAKLAKELKKQREREELGKWK